MQQCALKVWSYYCTTRNKYIFWSITKCHFESYILKYHRDFSIFLLADLCKTFIMCICNNTVKKVKSYRHIDFPNKAANFSYRSSYLLKLIICNSTLIFRPPSHHHIYIFLHLLSCFLGEKNRKRASRDSNTRPSSLKVDIVTTRPWILIMKRYIF